MSYTIVNRTGAKKRHIAEAEIRTHRFPSRYEAKTLCGRTIRGEYGTSYSQPAIAATCLECRARVALVNLAVAVKRVTS